MRKEIVVTKSMDNRKIEYVLSGDLSLSGSIIKKLKKTGGILLNGESVHVDKKLSEGDVLTIVLPKEQSDNIIPQKMELDILYEDCDMLAVNKPAGLETHPSRETYTGTLANGVMYYFGGKFTFRVITRLDKDTSGVVLIAKNALSAQRLNEDMRMRKINKEYLAVTIGVPEKEQGIINASIARAEGIKRVVSKDGKKAVTEYCVEKSTGRFSLIKLKPLTGRTHQIRVHLSYIGTPIYGDWLYGEEIACERVRLHCSKLEFNHPSSGEKIAVEAPIPEDIKCLVK